MSTRTIFLLVLLSLVGIVTAVVLGVMVSEYFLIIMPISGFPLALVSADITDKYYERKWRA